MLGSEEAFCDAVGPQRWQAARRPVLMSSETYRFDQKHVVCPLLELAATSSLWTDGPRDKDWQLFVSLPEACVGL